MRETHPSSPPDNTGAAPDLPLKRLLVLDLTLARAGPTCVRHLADWGADVIRIESPNSEAEEIAGKRDGFDFQNLHRNKRAIQLNLKSPEGHAAFMKLAAKADVIIENMRSAVKHRLKIGYSDVSAVNPRIVYGSISGFGQDGPYGKRAGVDQIVQGMGGLMSITGDPAGGPMRTGIAITDMTAGNLLALGVMVALYDRQVTGRGRWVYTSLLEAQVFMLDFQAARWLMQGEVAGQAGNDHPTAIPSGVFPVSDGFITIAASSGRLWERFATIIGKPEWLKTPEWQDQAGRSADRKNIHRLIGEITRQQPAEHWIALFEEAGIPAGPIYTIDKVFADPQVRHLGIARPVHHPRLGDIQLVGSPLNLGGLPKDIRTATPDAGADTMAVLHDLGYTESDIADLRKVGAI